MAEIPEPKPGLLFKYGYVWLEEHRSGRIDPSKDRPACIVARVADADMSLQTIGGNIELGDVIILPITTSPPLLRRSRRRTHRG